VPVGDENFIGRVTRALQVAQEEAADLSQQRHDFGSAGGEGGIRTREPFGYPLSKRAH
jgi:hypothetical protein